MANIVYDLVEPQLLINYVRAFDNEVLRNQFGLEAFLPNRLIDDLEYRIRAGTITDVDTAEYRAWDTPAPMTGRPGVSRIRGELVPVSRQIPLGEEEQLRLRSLLRGNNDPIVAAVYDDVERMIRSVQARIELARGQLLTTGKVTIAENGLAIEADFGLPAGHNVSAGTVWTDTVNATPLTNLLTWQDTYLTDTGVRPGVILMSQTRLGNLFLNAEMRAAAAAQGTTPSRINRELVDAIFAANGLPPVVLYDTMVRVNGVQTRVIPADKVLLLPPPGEPMGNTFYGITAEAIKLQGKGLIEETAMPGIVAVVTETDHPVQTFTVGTAVALPVLPNPELLFVADVAA
jgi:hypothetical protein